MKKNQDLKEKLLKMLKEQNGVLFAKPAIVHRIMYSGRDIIAKNSTFSKEYIDERGYVPVEWWIMSTTQAENDTPKENEGLTEIKIGENTLLLKDALKIAEKELMGEYTHQWPLTKILDIGGEPVKTSFGSEEAPPIPAHVHAGICRNGKMHGPGKLEAYFFPPIDVPPYHKNFGHVVTRLGIKPETTREEFKRSLQQFGKSDQMYTLLNVYEIKPYDGWTIRSGTVHAPGAWTTFEIQTPQDDFNLASWQLGKRFSEAEIEEKRHELLLRGLKDEDDFVQQAVDWKTSTHPQFKRNHYRPSQVIEEGSWGRRLQIFFDEFYGEAFEIQPGETFTRKADERPFAGIVWSGEGMINGNAISAVKEKEFLVVPKREVEIKNKGDTILLVYTVFPIE